MPRPKRARQPAKPAQQQPEPQVQTEAPATRRTRSMNTRNSSAEHQALQSAKRTRDAALDRLANEDGTTTATGTSTGEDDTLESVEVGRRATTPQRRDTTGLDLGDDIFGDLEDSFENIKVPGSGRSWDNSSIYGGGSSHMKPRSRSRQSSIIGRNDPPIRPSSRNGNTPLMSSSFNIGAFRRRAREPSILGTAQKNSSRADLTATTLNAHESELEGGEEMEMGDFAPEAESTPVNNRRRSRRSIHQQQLQQEREASPSLPELSMARKRKSDVAAEGSDRPEKASRTGTDDIPQLDISSDSESESDLSSPAAPPPARSLRPRITNERPVTPNQEDFAAPPASSGSESEGEFWPDIRGLARRRRRPSVHEVPQTDALSDVSSPPSLTHSPNFGGKTKGRGRSRTRREVSPPPLTTADLANLLPKRRQKGPRTDVEVEFDTSGLGRDQDELSLARSTRKRTGSRATSTRSASRAAAQNTAANSNKTTDAGNKDAAAPTTTGRVTRSSRRNAKTYSRRQSDKENDSAADSDLEGDIEESMFEPHVDETFDGSAADSFVVTEELRAARRKFEEVDQWEMSFEEEEDEELMIEAR